MDKQTKAMREFQSKVLTEGWVIVQWTASSQGEDEWEFRLQKGDRTVEGDGHTSGDSFLVLVSEPL